MGTVAERPNILWIVSEDCPPWFGCYGDAHAVTPAIDAVASRGVLYERAYSPAPVCSPSRFALLTGIAPESHSPADRMRAVAARPDWMATYPEIFRDAGYYCTNNAKTDYNLDVDANAIWDESSRTAHWRNRPAGAPFLAVFNYDPTHESSVFDANSPLARAIGSSAVFGEPLTPAVPLEAIRLPRYLPDTPEVRSDFSRYYSAVARLDTFVAGLLGQLAEDGLAEDTVVLLTSDHGGVTPRSKRYLYDEGLHVPLLVSAPPRLAGRLAPAGSRHPEPVSTLSVAPTLLALAGLPVPPQMAEQPLTEPTGPTGPALAFGERGRMDERFSLVRTVRSRRFRYLRTYTPHRPVIQHQAFAWNAAAFRSWEAEHTAGRLTPEQERWWLPAEPVELYDVDADPDEVENLAGRPEFAEVEAQLRQALREHILAGHDNGFLPEDSPLLGWDASRAPGAYPLERILDLADRGLERDSSVLPELLTALGDDDATVRRWAAIGILRLTPGVPDAAAPLRAALADPEPSVVVHAAEALARLTGDEDAYRALARVAASESTPWARLEAVNALTYLDLDRVRPYRQVVDAAATSGSEYLSSAGRYLRLLLDDEYTPDAAVYDPAPLLAAFKR
ncbi:sulfatase-like hydrolase/transferase [Kitasatospora sp. NPDC059463]|uniref:sulfatase-like hydrolase/transferase n=1 Tax=unclassified Kitasatospora TaxID=2633591 RepID=UPI0036ACAC61